MSSTFLKGSSSNSEFLTFAVKRNLKTKTCLHTDLLPDPGPDVRNAVREEWDIRVWSDCIPVREE